jgi:hypothetical protein
MQEGFRMNSLYIDTDPFPGYRTTAPEHSQTYPLSVAQ